MPPEFGDQLTTLHQPLPEPTAVTLTPPATGAPELSGMVTAYVPVLFRLTVDLPPWLLYWNVLLGV